ncbi:O-antigen ligase family protein [Persicobacter psychrovividus]|uniref:O-antigen ligase-related domain-containing protein n=1 Tax=Persicobacter psychrovividus TaxID=387638 RepID=A0ABN6LB18_9BACT|nr:hypothetical protein PEPS_22890 [Persicobacter psychrovividus]
MEIQRREITIKSGATYLIIALILLFRLIADQSYFHLPKVLGVGLSMSGLLLFLSYFIYKGRHVYSLFDKYFLYWFLFVLVFSILNKSIIAYPFASFKEVSRVFLLFLTSIFCSQYLSYKSLHRLFKYSFYLITLGAILQIVRVLPYISVVDGNRIESFTGHPNALANFYVIQMVYWLFLWTIKGYRLSRWYFFGSFIFLGLTSSRAAILFAVFIVCVFGMYFLRGYVRSFANKAFIYLGAVFVLFLFFYLMRDRFLGEITKVMSGGGLMEIVQNRDLSGSMTWRLYNWYSLLSYSLVRHPWIGCGINVTDILNVEITGAPLQAHNDYVKYLFETGVLGFTFHLSLLIWWVKKLREISYKPEHILFMVSFIGFSLIKLIDGLEQSNIFLIFFIAFGAVLYRKQEVKYVANNSI